MTYKRLQQWLIAWDAWWFRQGPPHALALVRIALGLFLAVFACTYVPFWRLLFTNEGLVMPLLGHIPVFAAPPPWIAIMIMIVFFVALTLFTIGFCYRPAALSLVLLSLYVWQLHLHVFPTSYNRVLIVVLAVLAFSDANAVLSVDSRRRHGTWLGWVPVSLFPQRLIAVQLTATYLGLGFLKLVFKAWQGGDILAYSFVSMWSTPVSFWFVRLNLPMPFYDLLVQCVTAFEVFIPFAIWYRPWRPWFVAGGVLFHSLIAVMMSIWWFVALFPLYLFFWDPDEIRVLVERSFGSFKSKTTTLTEDSH